MALKESDDEKKDKKKAPSIAKQLQKNDVKSVQRITIPSSWTIEQTANYYVNWLSRIGYSFINTSIENEVLNISLPIFKDPILIL